jgi:hypothetical protein
MADKKNEMFKQQDDVHKEIDDLLNQSPIELKKVTDNLAFINKITDKPLEPGKFLVTVFGCEIVDISAILKKNIYNRSIFTVDKLCKLFLKMDLEQKKKYLRKKRPMDFNYMWLIILLIGIPIVIIVLVLLVPKLMGG